MGSFFYNRGKTGDIVKGERECIFRKLDNNEYLLSVYKDDSWGDYRDNKDNRSDEHNPLYLINESAAIAWYFLKDCPTPEGLLNSLKEYYTDLDEQRIRKDLDDFLKKLYQFHLISLSEKSRVKNNASVFSSSLDDVEIKQKLKEKQKYSPFCIKPLVIDQPVYAQGGEGGGTCLICDPEAPQPILP